MYSSTQIGHIAQIRHLAADLHLDCDLSIVKNLSQHMNKLHLVGGCRPTSENSVGKMSGVEEEELKEFLKASAAKVLYFSEIKSYCDKIKAAI